MQFFAPQTNEVIATGIWRGSNLEVTLAESAAVQVNTPAPTITGEAHLLDVVVEASAASVPIWVDSAAISCPAVATLQEPLECASLDGDVAVVTLPSSGRAISTVLSAHRASQDPDRWLVDLQMPFQSDGAGVAIPGPILVRYEAAEHAPMLCSPLPEIWSYGTRGGLWSANTGQIGSTATASGTRITQVQCDPTGLRFTLPDGISGDSSFAVTVMGVLDESTAAPTPTFSWSNESITTVQPEQHSRTADGFALVSN